MIIRNAKISDAQAILELSEELGYSPSYEEVKSRIESLVKDDRNLVLVAEEDEKVVGWIHAFLAYRIESAPFAEIGGLVVSELYRRKGIGNKLLQEAIKWAKDKNVKKLRVRSNVIRDDAKDFYTKNEFEISKQQNIFDKFL